MNEEIENPPVPLVSVLMCSYNGLGYIEKAVNDITNQTFDDWELLISDDDSRDGTREWLVRLPRDPRIRIFLQKQNLGYVKNKNFLLSNARGRFITQQDQDDRSHASRLERQLEILLRSDLQISACAYLRVGSDGKVLQQVGPKVDCELRYPITDDYPFWFPSLLFSRRVYEEIGNFNEYFSGAYGDDHYWTVLASERFPIACLAEPLYSYVDTPSSVTCSLNEPRKLIMGKVLCKLFEQRKCVGTDWLELGETSSLYSFESQLLADRNLVASQLRVYAARSIDHGRFADAFRLIWSALKLKPLNFALLVTLVYALRSWTFRKKR